ncbi:hypothetical protein STCU_12002 [Strigomonas culicis]|uniref:Uncharacterized protein n=1 Tax=Strigomonas culicis TaxID=28005 RepID=S9UY49_9TRYP|nr:hypothetical protein STCU_12002 [Strigomonas culicis]|eukprot:EPY15470.1 hypothetical protein STCU_12002 [Strigomonas culicis]
MEDVLHCMRTADLWRLLGEGEGAVDAVLGDSLALLHPPEGRAESTETHRLSSMMVQQHHTKRTAALWKKPLQCLCCNGEASQGRYLMLHAVSPEGEAAKEPAADPARPAAATATPPQRSNAPQGSTVRKGLTDLPLAFTFCSVAKDVCLLERDAFLPLRELPHVHSCYWLLRSLPHAHRSARRPREADGLKHRAIGQYCVGYFRPVLQQGHRCGGPGSGPATAAAPPVLNSFYPTSVAGATSFERIEDPSVLLPFVVQPEGLATADGDGQRTALPSSAPFATTAQVLTLPREVLFSLAALPPHLQDQRLYRQFDAVPAPGDRPTSRGMTTTAAAAHAREAAEEAEAACAAADAAGAAGALLRCVYLLYPHRVRCSRRTMGRLDLAPAGRAVDSETFMDVESVVTLSPADARGGGSAPAALSHEGNQDGFLEHRVLEALRRQEAEPSLSRAERAYFSPENAADGRGGASKKLETRMAFSDGGDHDVGSICAELVQCQRVVHSLFENVC